jgi:hypothetical protein
MKYHCGPKIFPEWINKLLSKRFNLACKVHDKAYANKIHSRFKADNYFLMRMIEASSSHVDVFNALAFYFIVRVLGWTRWGK